MPPRVQIRLTPEQKMALQQAVLHRGMQAGRTVPQEAVIKEALAAYAARWNIEWPEG
ncbi:MAG: hypothetical protein GF320_14280 [Armatimonadia bacterium]|nr:hypothetical protein [Armatimonadia bacterium]